MRPRPTYKQKPKAYTPPDNIELAAKLNVIDVFWRKANIEQVLLETKDLVEHYFDNKYNQTNISRYQKVAINQLIASIKTYTPAEFPLAQLIHAMFTARKGSAWIDEAHAAYEQIHRNYPDYSLAYEKHIKLCQSNGELALKKALCRRMKHSTQTHNHPSPVPTSTEVKSIRQNPPILTKPATEHFNPVVGSDRFNCALTLFSDRSLPLQ